MLECTKINIDGLDVISDKYFFTLDGLFNNDTDIIMNDLNTDGQRYDHTKIQVKKVVLDGWIKSKQMKDFLKLRQVLCNKNLKTFTISMSGIEDLTFKAQLQTWVDGSIGKFSIACSLVLPDPYLYALSSQIISLGAVVDNSLNFPTTFPITFGNIIGESDIIVNKGTASAYPVITVIGSCSDILITNVTTGEYMYINYQLLENDVLEIDNNPLTRSIKLNGAIRMDLKNGTWITCDVGDNEITFNRNSLESIFHCTVNLKSRYI